MTENWSMAGQVLFLFFHLLFPFQQKIGLIMSCSFAIENKSFIHPFVRKFSHKNYLSHTLSVSLSLFPSFSLPLSHSLKNQTHTISFFCSSLFLKKLILSL